MKTIANFELNAFVRSESTLEHYPSDSHFHACLTDVRSRFLCMLYALVFCRLQSSSLYLYMSGNSVRSLPTGLFTSWVARSLYVVEYFHCSFSSIWEIVTCNRTMTSLLHLVSHSNVPLLTARVRALNAATLPSSLFTRWLYK